MTFAGKVALVTGGASGIGRAAAEAFAAEGATVMVADIDGHRAAEAAESLPHAVAVRVDVTDAGETAAMVRTCVERLGSLDLFFNNAGIAGSGAPIHELSEREWDRVMAVNLRGAWLALKHVLAHMRAASGGAVVNTVSVAGQRGFAKLAAYCASKAGLISLTQVAAIENAGHAIRVNAVCPGMIATPLAEAGAPADAAGPYPAGRLGRPEEVAQAVVWLCSAAASYVNGTCLVVDGAWTTAGGPRFS